MLTNGPLHCPGLSPPPPAAVFTSSKPIIIAPEAELCSCDNTRGSGFHLCTLYMLLGFDDMIIEVTMTTENLKEMIDSILLNEASPTKI